MAKKKFTEQEMKLLKTSAYVLEVSPHKVYFTAEYKMKFWQLLMMGKTPQEATIELGIDPEILGVNRINGMRAILGSEIRKGKGFRDIKNHIVSSKGYANPEVKIRYLEQQLAYKDQEIEFLKKIVSLNKGASES